MKQKLGLIINGLLVTMNFVGLGIGAYWVYSSTIGYESPYIIEETLRKPSSLPESVERGINIYTMEKFVVNLSGQPQRKIMLQINLDMMSAQSFSEILETEKTAKARDKIIRLLNERSFADIETIQGKLFLKDKIVEEVNKILVAGLVKDVYFTDFVVN
ncbi:MAG: flagellar basal body-associated protein FliL [Pseudobdellovibrio sp.]